MSDETGLPADLTTLSEQQLQNLSSKQLNELEQRASHATPEGDRLAGSLWTRDQVATYWPCSPSSVPKIAARYGIERVGTDDISTQATYRAEDVAVARGSRHGQGARTDIRDHNLATADEPYYLLGRAVAAVDTITDQHYPPGQKTASFKIQERGGRLTNAVVQQLHHELTTTARRKPKRPTLERVARNVASELLPQVEHLRSVPAHAQQHTFFTGFHHQRGALWDAVRTAATNEDQTDA